MEQTETVIELKETPEDKKAAKKEAYLNKMAAGREKAKAKRAIEANPVVMVEVEETPVAAPAIAVKEEKIIWFSEIDLNQHGRPSSDFPGRYFPQHIADLKEEITGIERNLDQELYRGSHLVKARKDLANKKARLEKIVESTPKLSATMKDKVAAVARDLGTRIGAAMFTREEKQKGLVDAHVEADRWVNPCIEVKSDIEADYYKQKGVKIVNGKVNRTQAEIFWKTMTRDLGEDTTMNTERLRAQR